MIINFNFSFFILKIVRKESVFYFKISINVNVAMKISVKIINIYLF